MHRLYPLVLLLLFVYGAAASEQALLARVTVYWHSPASKERIAASGPFLHDGHCAVDPKKIPYGSDFSDNQSAPTASDSTVRALMKF